MLKLLEHLCLFLALQLNDTFVVCDRFPPDAVTVLQADRVRNQNFMEISRHNSYLKVEPRPLQQNRGSLMTFSPTYQPPSWIRAIVVASSSTNPPVFRNCQREILDEHGCCGAFAHVRVGLRHQLLPVTR